MFGIEVIRNEYLRSVIILIVFLSIGFIANRILKKYLSKLTEKSKRDIYRNLINKITGPLYFLVILIGAYLAVRPLSFLSAYSKIIDSITFVLIILGIVELSSRILTILISKWLKIQKRFEKTPELIKKIVTIVAYLIALLLILDYFKVQVTPIIATLGIGGLAVGLALQSTLSNFFAGLSIISDRPINVYDFVELENGLSGYIEDIGWRSTKIRTRDNNYVIISNSKLAETMITNYSMPEQELTIRVECGVSYDSDLEKVEKVAVEVAKQIQNTNEDAIKSFEPFIRYYAFGDSNIQFTTHLRARNINARRELTHHFIKELKKRFDKEGIEISYPVRKVYQAK